jgi:hypothetical protein
MRAMRHTSLRTLDVSRIGLGTMAMSGYYLDPSSSDAESIRTIQRALDLGVTHIDTAEIYGPYANEELVGRALKGRRDGVVLATKFGLVSHADAGPGVLDARRRRRPDPRHQARLPRRGEHRRRRHRLEPGAGTTAQRPPPGHRRAPRRGQHVRHRPLTMSWAPRMLIAGMPSAFLPVPDERLDGGEPKGTRCARCR